MDFIEIAILPAIVVFILTSVLTLLYKHKFKIKDPLTFFNLLNVIVFLLYLGWLLMLPNGGSGAFVVALFSIFFAPIVLLLFIVLFKILNFYDDKIKENNIEVVQGEEEVGGTFKPAQSGDQISQ